MCASSGPSIATFPPAPFSDLRFYDFDWRIFYSLRFEVFSPSLSSISGLLVSSTSFGVSALLVHFPPLTSSWVRRSVFDPAVGGSPKDGHFFPCGQSVIRSPLRCSPYHELVPTAFMAAWSRILVAGAPFLASLQVIRYHS